MPRVCANCSSARHRMFSGRRMLRGALRHARPFGAARTTQEAARRGCRGIDSRETQRAEAPTTERTYASAGSASVLVSLPKSATLSNPGQSRGRALAGNPGSR